MMKTPFPLIICLLLMAPAPLSFGLTVEEVIHLKQQGISDETIQLMIQQEMQRDRLADPHKNIGVHRVEEPDGRSATIYSTGENGHRDSYEEETGRERREKAWEMLHNIVIDTREEKSTADEKERSRNR